MTPPKPASLNHIRASEKAKLLWFGRYHCGGSVVFGCGQFRMFRPGLGFGQRYHVDRHGQLTLKQLRLSVLNEMHTNSYTGPRLTTMQRLCHD